MRKKKMPEPYKIADLVMETLVRRVRKRTEKTKRKLSILDFDDLHVMDETETLYEHFSVDIRAELRGLYGARYMEVYEWLTGKYPEDDTVDELVEMYLAGIWKEPNESTHYAFGPELSRKKEKAQEAIRAVPTKVQKQIEMDKAGRFVIQQCGFYVDIASQDAEKKAMEDAGIQKVKWNIYGDDRVCKTCYDRNGKIYEISKVPPRPHLRCRCYLTPV